MSITIHYRGRFNEDASLAEMIGEIDDIANIFGWKSYVFEESFPNGALGKTEHNDELYGLQVTPPQSEPLWLCFFSNGIMSNPVVLEYGQELSKDETLPWLFTKTQYAGPGAHKQVVHLLKYLQENYLEDLEVHDEAEFWETGSEKLCEAHFKRMNELLDTFAVGLETLQKDEGESIESYMERLFKIINNKN